MLMLIDFEDPFKEVPEPVEFRKPGRRELAVFILILIAIAGSGFALGMLLAKGAL